jgi:hypothetical protein
LLGSSIFPAALRLPSAAIRIEFPLILCIFIKSEAIEIPLIADSNSLHPNRSPHPNRQLVLALPGSNPDLEEAKEKSG